MSEESKELDGNVSTAELLGEVKTAIRKILIGGQSYQIGSRKLTRADLLEKDIPDRAFVISDIGKSVSLINLRI